MAANGSEPRTETGFTGMHCLRLNLTSADYFIHMDPWWNPAGALLEGGDISGGISAEALLKLIQEERPL